MSQSRSIQISVMSVRSPWLGSKTPGGGSPSSGVTPGISGMWQGPFLLLCDGSEFAELRYADIDATLDGRRVLLARVEFLGEGSVVADEEGVLLVLDGVAVIVEFQGVLD